MQAAKRAVRLGYDVIELHMTHGYLVHQFLSPLTNTRTDKWGGTPEKRMAFALHLMDAVKAAIPSHVALGVRIAGSDWMEGGVTIDDAITLTTALKAKGAAYACVSSGGLDPAARIKVGPGYQVDFAEAIKKKIGSAVPGSEVKEMEVRGRNLSEGVPRSFTISSNEILEALTDPLNNIVSAVKNALEQTPPELGADIADRGMMLTGGGALLRDLDRLLAEETGLPVLVAEDPLTCVVRGCGIALEQMERLGSIFTNE